MSARRLSLLDRFRAWIVTGPVGHLYGGAVDWLELAARYALARLTGRPPEAL